jgi:hypothetical protein
MIAVISLTSKIHIILQQIHWYISADVWAQNLRFCIPLWEKELEENRLLFKLNNDK